MEILDKKKLLTMEEGMYVNGYAYVQNYSLLPQKNGGKYIAGQMQIKGQIPFKVWSDTRQDSAFVNLVNDQEGYKNIICQIKGKVDRYGGVTSLIVDSIKAVNAKEIGLSISDFLEEVYDINNWFDRLETTLEKNCSKDAVDLFNEIISSVKDRFVLEYAAVSHHDNCKSGLLAHTTKVVRIATLVKMYPEILKRVSADVLFISCALHDIGKVYEYFNGAVSDTGKLISHHTFGVLILKDYENTIKDKMGDKFYYSLLSVIGQHHGEWGERPRTVVAYVVHLVDELEATLTSLDSLLAESNGEQISYNGYKLI